MKPNCAPMLGGMQCRGDLARIAYPCLQATVIGLVQSNSIGLEEVVAMSKATFYGNMSATRIRPERQHFSKELAC